jgi:hypothetical protein
MKYLFALLFVFLTGCSQDLKVGDCYMGIFDYKPILLKVVKVGRYSYESVDVNGALYCNVKAGLKDQQVDCFGFPEK